MRIPSEHREPSSFRDPSGFMFWHEGEIFRQVNPSYAATYAQVAQSGILESLLSDRSMLPWEEVERNAETVVLKPVQLPFVSYPYEWSFSQLQDAADLTLAIQLRCLEKGMTLKDASAFNIQFWKGAPTLIDGLSIEPLETGSGWVAYRQFCEQFLAPLLISSYVDPRLNLLSQPFLDGIPLELASRLLPKTTKFRFGIAAHIHLHAKNQRTTVPSAAKDSAGRSISIDNLKAMIFGLKELVGSLSLPRQASVWQTYYEETNYDSSAMEEKRSIVLRFLSRIAPRPTMVWDLGSNTGEFSRLSSEMEMLTIGLEQDVFAADKAYQTAKKSRDAFWMPLVQDLTNPSPSLGWDGCERKSLFERGPASVAMALALVHHLSIAHNIPFDRLSMFLVKCGEWLIIEFVPKEDSQVQRMLASRVDIFNNYNIENFEKAIAKDWEIVERSAITGTHRTMFLCKQRGM